MQRNVHDIAIELEHILSREFNADFAHSGTIFSADFIEVESFHDSMVLLLYLKSDKDCIDFINDIYEFKGVNMNKIPNCEAIFEKFKSFLPK